MSENTVTSILKWAGIIGCLISVILWASGILSDWAMLGVTLVLSWAALWYAAYIAIKEKDHSKEVIEKLDKILAKD